MAQSAGRNRGANAVGTGRRVGYAALIALSLITVRADGAAAGINCSEIPGFVSFGSLDVVPVQPMVGDSIQLQFNVSFQVYSVEHTALLGLAPLLQQQSRSGSTTFQVLALMAGTADVQLQVTYGTEESCENSDGSNFFRIGPDRTVTSQVYSVDILEAPSPTPSPTNTPAPSPTATPSPTVGSGNGTDDGCQVSTSQSSRVGSLLPLAGIPLLAGLRKSRSRGRRPRRW